MKSKWMVEDMNTAWKYDGPWNAKYYSGMRPNHPLHSIHSRRALGRKLKNKWRREARRQYNEEINEYLMAI